jgi:dissimilatory sulfite reductase (desulfoviridin) alpha/beta subunit
MENFMKMRISAVLTEKATLFKVIETAVQYFACRAQKGERLGKFMDRIGIEEFKKIMEVAL